MTVINISSLLTRLNVLSTNTDSVLLKPPWYPLHRQLSFFSLIRKLELLARCKQSRNIYEFILGVNQTLSWSTWPRRKQAHIRHLSEDEKKRRRIETSMIQATHKIYDRSKMFCLSDVSVSSSLTNRHRFKWILRQSSYNLLRHTFFFHRANDTWHLFFWGNADQIFLSSFSIPIKRVSICCCLNLVLSSSRW